MSQLLSVLTACLLVGAAACARNRDPVSPPQPAQPHQLAQPSVEPPTASSYAVDAGGRAIRTLESGSTLHVGAQALQPLTLYEFRATLDDGRPVSFARSTTDQFGNIKPFVLWYESGVVGCAARRLDRADPARFRFRTFEEADAALAGRSIIVTTHRVPRNSAGVRPSELRAHATEFTFRLPLTPRQSPMVFPSDSAGCLTNAAETGHADMFVSGRNFSPREVLALSVVANQREWHVGAVVDDVTGATERVKVGADGRFIARLWPHANQFSGAFDIVAQRLRDRPEKLIRHLAWRDIVSFGSETAFLLFLAYPPGGPHMDLAGRPLGSSPYFEFADAFADTSDPVWGAVDPTYVPAGHPGGTYAAYYVVKHKTDVQWAVNRSLTDVSGGVEIHPVKAYCVNATEALIWPPQLTLGPYDVVVEFGSSQANSAATFTGDATYDPTADFLDGSVQIGFQVARDPWELGTFPVGKDSYSQDDYFATMGGASNVDLRAVVRYPAITVGTAAPAAPGPHPLFLIQHGNHSLCKVLTDGTPWYTALAAAIDGTMSWADFSSKQHTHATCPVAKRELNHLGYMRLLDNLASHGVIAVSIDAYDLTGSVPAWIKERGTLILKHLELWSHMNNPAQFPGYTDYFAGRFAGRVDLTRTGVSGHSRGGEASVAAYMLNGSASPFSITSVSSIAPVDNVGFTLSGVPYFVILPAADCDVSDLSGQRIYDRAGSNIADKTTKSASYVYGANHDFFNTVWAADWDDCRGTMRQDFITAGNQQRIGEAFLAAFHRAYLLGESVYDDMLRSGLRFPSLAGYKIYNERHETDHRKLLSGGVPAGLTAASGASVTAASNPSPHQTSATRVGWTSGTGILTYTVPPAQVDASSFEVLSFRVAQTAAAANPASTNQNFLVELVGGGVTRGVYAGQFDVIPPRYPHPLGLSHTVMTTVRVPLHSFIMNNSGLTLNNVDTIRFRFYSPVTGELYVDDVEFSR